MRYVLVFVSLVFMVSCGKGKELGCNPDTLHMIESDKMYEDCMTLKKDQILHYCFTSEPRLLFNIHYHTNDPEDHVNEITIQSTTDGEGSAIIPKDDKYCLMWNNLSNTKAKVKYGYFIETPVIQD